MHDLLVKQFLCAAPLNEIAFASALDGITWDQQHELVKRTVLRPVNVDYPVKLSYQRAFLKRVIETLEDVGVEVHDSVYDAYGRLVSVPSDGRCHKHFVAKSGETFTFRENPSIVSEGTTGLSSWQAGVALAEWCVANRHLLNGKTVLELGSGVGTTGVIAAVLCDPHKVYLTDCHGSVLENLRENVRINGENKRTEVLELPWSKVCTELVDDLGIDLVLGADVVYDDELFDELVEAVRSSLSRTEAEAVLALTERNKETLASFLELLGEKCNVAELSAPPRNNFYWSTDCPVRIFSVTKKCDFKRST